MEFHECRLFWRKHLSFARIFSETISKRFGRSLETWNSLDVLLIPLVGAASCEEVYGVASTKQGYLAIPANSENRVNTEFCSLAVIET